MLGSVRNTAMERQSLWTAGPPSLLHKVILDFFPEDVSVFLKDTRL